MTNFPVTALRQILRDVLFLAIPKTIYKKKSTPNSNCNIVALCNSLSEVENILPCERATNHTANIIKSPNMNNDKMIEWIVTHNTGISSRTMWTALMGVQPKSASPLVSFDIPYDSADFSRCYDLVSFCGINPAYDFPKITAVFPWYAPILDRWETLSLLYERKQWGKFTEIMYEAISESRNLRGIKTY